MERIAAKGSDLPLTPMPHYRGNVICHPHYITLHNRSRRVYTVSPQHMAHSPLSHTPPSDHVLYTVCYCVLSLVGVHNKEQVSHPVSHLRHGTIPALDLR